MKVNHFKRQRFRKKIRRRKARMAKAQLRDSELNASTAASTDCDNEITVDELQWLEREKLAQAEWERKQKTTTKSDSEPFVSADIVADILAEKARTVPLQPRLPFDLPFHNPFEPAAFVDASQQRDICHFFRKTGVCRFDLRCSRLHESPLVSDTIVFFNMFHSSSMELMMAGDDPGDSNLEHDDSDLVGDYDEFYADVEKELSSFGRVVTIRTCRNAMRHLRGNLYVQYRHINDAVHAFARLNGRFYGGQRLAGRFVSIDSWRESICGLYFRGRCPKGAICNFLHVLLNSGETTRDLHRFLNGRSTDSHRSHHRRRETESGWRSRTCSSLDDAESTPEPAAEQLARRDKSLPTSSRKRSARSGSGDSGTAKRSVGRRERLSRQSGRREQYGADRAIDRSAKRRRHSPSSSPQRHTNDRRRSSNNSRQQQPQHRRHHKDRRRHTKDRPRRRSPSDNHSSHSDSSSSDSRRCDRRPSATRHRSNRRVASISDRRNGQSHRTAFKY